MRIHRSRRYAVLAASLIALVTIPVAPAGAAGRSPWPDHPDWQRYVESPSTTHVRPATVLSASDGVTNPGALTGGRGATTLTRSADGPDPVVVLDYGKEIGGTPRFTVTAASGNPVLRASYSETRANLTATGDGGTPFGPGDPHRYDDYTVGHPGTITNSYVQGGERYQRIALTSPGSVTLSAAEIRYEPYLGTPDTYAGTFVSSSDELNRIWYDGVYTLNLNQLTPNTPGANWQVRDDALHVAGGYVGQLSKGADWTDYTMSMRVRVDNKQAGWVIREQAGGNAGDMLILTPGATADAPGTLQQLVFYGGGQHYRIRDAILPFPIHVGTWYDVATTVSGDTVSTSVNGTPVASVSTGGLPAGVTDWTRGTIGFREASGEAASIADLRVTDPAGRSLYRTGFTSSAALRDYRYPGTNTAPLILDGAKRDRAVWQGDLAVAGRTLLYSNDEARYLRESLRLLGSYQTASGFVMADQVPTIPLNKTGPLPGDNGPYASYSMYFVTNLADYYRYTGDLAFVKQEWPIAQRELAWSAAQRDANGLFAVTTDDGHNWNLETHSGALTYNNAVYYASLNAGAELAAAVGHGDTAASYRSDAATLRTTVNDTLYDPTLGAYDASTTDRGFVTQDANAAAVLYGLAPADRVSTVLATMRTALANPYGSLSVASPVPTGYTQDVSGFMGSFELWARFSAGDTAGALDLMRTGWGFQTTADPGGVFWERATPAGVGSSTTMSYAHAWSTGPTSALSQYVLGAAPASAGYRDWTVAPQPGDLAWAQGRVPTPHGKLDVKWGHDGDRFAMEVTAPHGTRGVVAVPTFGHSATVSVGGHVVWDGHAHPRGGVTGARVVGGTVELTVDRAGRYDIDSRTGA